MPCQDTSRSLFPTPTPCPTECLLRRRRPSQLTSPTRCPLMAREPNPHPSSTLGHLRPPPQVQCRHHDVGILDALTFHRHPWTSTFEGRTDTPLVQWRPRRLAPQSEGPFRPRRSGNPLPCSDHPSVWTPGPLQTRRVNEWLSNHGPRLATHYNQQSAHPPSHVLSCINGGQGSGSSRPENEAIRIRTSGLDRREKPRTFAALEGRGCGEIGRHARLRIWCFGVGVRVPPPAHFQETIRQPESPP